VANSTPHTLNPRPPGKTRYPLCRRLGGLQRWSGGVQKISLPPGFNPRIFRPVASRYNDYVVLAHMPNSIMMMIMIIIIIIIIIIIMSIIILISLQRLNLHPNTYAQMQKSEILGTCSSLRNFLNYV
jgi:hypothetical protein